MKSLEQSDPGIWNAFMNGEFSVKQNLIPFTSIGMDHAGEQENKIMKVEGGLIGISNNENERTRYFLVAPILANISKGYLNNLSLQSCHSSACHQNNASFKRRQTDILRKFENTDIFSFPPCSTNTYNIMTKTVLSDKASSELVAVEDKGPSLYSDFIKNRLGEDASQSIWDSLQKVNIPTFGKHGKIGTHKLKDNIIELKEHRGLFPRCAIVDFQMADWSLLQSVTSSNTFCTGDNVNVCLAILSQELQVQGFPPLPINSGGDINIVPLINALREILSRYQKERCGRDELENRHHRLSGDLEHQKGSVTRLKRQLEQLDKEASEESEKKRQITNKCKLQSAKLKTEKEEVKRLNLVLKSRDMKYKHELKKKEQELAKLKDRLHQLLNDKNCERTTGLELINVIQRPDGKRGTWNTRVGGKQEEEMYQGMLTTYEERHQELLCENSQLRDCLYSMQKNLAAIVNRPDLSVADISPFKIHRSTSNQSIGTDDDDDVDIKNQLNIDDVTDNGYYQLPLETIQKNIEKNFQDTCEKIKKTLCRQKDNLNGTNCKPAASKQLMLTDVNTTVVTTNGYPPVSSTMSPVTPHPQPPDQFVYMSHLQHQVSAYRDIIQKQEELLHLQVKSREQENIERQQKLIDREKSEIEEKRIQYSLASAELDRQRQRLEEEKYVMLQQEFLCLSPFKDEKISPFKAETPRYISPEIVPEAPHVRLLPATPVYSPARIPNNHKHSTDMLRARISHMFSSGEQSGDKKKKCKSRESSSSLQSLQSLSSSDTSILNSDTSIQNLTLDQLDQLKQTLLIKSLSRTSKSDK
ncbi:hypothetical protein LOTGIDRAFT_158523 [Lottia gigantea]|uniref:Uncharacterized protein n=1 Tax=Lottia gigantea TaxID=225164 RepID=V4A6B4_LOTGI|nr:hypothetical protein LOTGIDRAFT_158523 [Lottia gigantea]ESO99438.1 hypothetical protein LOTGIDRAFT_158523 [Lottia gigantea]